MNCPKISLNLGAITKINLNMPVRKAISLSFKEARARWGAILGNTEDQKDFLLSNLNDVDITGIADDKILKYNLSEGKWKVVEDESGTDENVKISSGDTTSGYLEGKIVVDSTLTKSIENIGLNESLKLRIADTVISAIASNTTHRGLTDNPHSVTKTQVGLVNVDNTSDLDKPVSTATQTALNLKINLTEKAANNGVATLDAGGKVPVSQLPSSLMEYKGTWNASTNTPTLADGTGDNGDVYLCNVSGTQDLGSGSIDFVAGDWVVYNGTIWEKSINSNIVMSVNGQTGVVVLDTSHVAATTNKNYVTDSDLINLSNLSGTNTGDQDLSGYFTLDQTTPQTVINGAPIFDDGLISNGDIKAEDGIFSGNVGIGHGNSPSWYIDVRGDNPFISVADADSAIRNAGYRMSTASGPWYMMSGFNSGADGDLHFNFNGLTSAEALVTIKNNGDVTMSETLEVAGSLSCNGLFFNSDGTNSNIEGISNHIRLKTTRNFDDIIFSPNGVEAMRIDATNQYTGIGTATPNVHLHILDTGTATSFGSSTMLALQNTGSGGSNVRLGFASGINGSNIIDFGDTADTDAGRIVYNHEFDKMCFDVNASERMCIDSDGNVGIGISSPSNKLHLNSDTVTTSLQITNTGTGTGAGNGLHLLSSGLTGYLWNRESGDLSFGTNNSEVGKFTSDGDFRVNTDTLAVDASSGRVGIGTTTPDTKLHTVGAITIEEAVNNHKATLTMNQFNTLVVGDTTQIQLPNVYMPDDTVLKFGTDPDYWIDYNSGQERLRLTSTDIDGIGTNGEIWSISDGTQDISFPGRVVIGTAIASFALHVDSGTDNTVAYFKSSDSGADIVLEDNLTYTRLRNSAGVCQVFTNGDAALMSSISNTLIQFNQQHNDADFRYDGKTNDAVFFIDATNETTSINGGNIRSVATKTNDYTLLSNDYSIVADGSSNTVTITLPASPTTGQVYNIACLNSDNTVDIDFNGKNFYDSSSNEVLFKGENLKIQYTDSVWIGI